MSENRFLKQRKGLFVQGKIRDKEQLIKVTKSQAAALAIKGKITVVDISNYNQDLDGQSVVVEYGREYNTPGSGRRETKK